MRDLKERKLKFYLILLLCPS